MIPDENSHLRKLERELYTTDIIPPKRRSVLHDEPSTLPDDWSDAPPSQSSMKYPRKPTSFFKNLFKVSAAFFVIACIVLVVSLLTGTNTISARNVEIDIIAKSFVDGGESLPVTVSVVNRNKVPMELTTLVLEYPQGGNDAAGSGAVASLTRELGTIEVGATRQETFTVQLYGQEGSQKNITARVQFRVPSSNAVYDKENNALVVVRTSPVRLTLEAPAAIASNQEIPLKFSIAGNGTAAIPNTALVLEYPPGFTFTRADPAPSFDNRVWYLGDIPPGADRTITVYGTLAGSLNELKTIRASIGSQNKNDEAKLDTTYNSVVHAVSVTGAFLAASLRIQNSNDPVVPISNNNNAGVSIQWANTLSTQLSDAEIRVKLSGSGYDPALVQPGNGYFDSANNQIVWTKQQVSALGAIQPGASGMLAFSLGVKTAAVSNPTINLSVDILGTQAGGERIEAKGIESKKIAVSSNASMLASTVHYGGQIQNSGPMPPVVNKETTYTLDWKITNSYNKMTNGRVTTVLPINVSWKDVVTPQSELANISYNTVTREVVWNVGDIPAGGGSSAPVRSVSFKVGIIPSSAQVSTRPELTGDITFSARDSFTNVVISASRPRMTTLVLNDISTTGTDGRVVAQ